MLFANVVSGRRINEPPSMIPNPRRHAAKEDLSGLPGKTPTFLWVSALAAGSPKPGSEVNMSPLGCLHLVLEITLFIMQLLGVFRL